MKQNKVLNTQPCHISVRIVLHSYCQGITFYSSLVHRNTKHQRSNIAFYNCKKTPNSHRYILVSLYCKIQNRNKLWLVLHVLTLLDLCMWETFPLTISLILPPGGILWEVVIWKRRQDKTWKRDLSWGKLQSSLSSCNRWSLSTASFSVKVNTSGIYKRRIAGAWAPLGYRLANKNDRGGLANFTVCANTDKEQELNTLE